MNALLNGLMCIALAAMACAGGLFLRGESMTRISRLRAMDGNFVNCAKLLRDAGILHLICAKNNVNTMLSATEIVLVTRIIINKTKMRLIGHKENIRAEELRDSALIENILLGNNIYERSIIAAYVKLMNKEAAFHVDLRKEEAEKRKAAGRSRSGTRTSVGLSEPEPDSEEAGPSSDEEERPEKPRETGDVFLEGNWQDMPSEPHEDELYRFKLFNSGRRINFTPGSWFGEAIPVKRLILYSRDNLEEKEMGAAVKELLDVYVKIFNRGYAPAAAH